MKNTYKDLIEQSYYFPNSEFELQKGYLTFHGVSIKSLIEKYGTPFKMMYLPSIRKQISKAKALFNSSFEKYDYKGKYHYSYCTKCSHFAHVVDTVLQEGVHLETSSSFDVDLILSLFEKEKVDPSTIIIHNGYKTDSYLEKIFQLKKSGFNRSIIILDSKNELERIVTKSQSMNLKMNIGIRMAIDEEPQSAYFTSRLGIQRKEILDFYQAKIKNNEFVKLKMLHFFVDSGIKDNMYYWGEFQKALELFVELKKESTSLDSFNLGGGFPIKNNLGFEFDYSYMVDEIVENIAKACKSEGIGNPDIYTEFGKYTVGESGATIFSVLEQKEQNDTELWYMIDNSLLNTVPDAWSLFERFILLPINKWEYPYSKVNIGGISCDRSDYYNSEDFNEQIHLPNFSNVESEPLYLGFFHTGAYQDSISGYGGAKHCLIPSPKYLIIDKNDNGQLEINLFRQEQSIDEILEVLGYSD